MVHMLLRLVGIDANRVVREAAITLVLAILGSFAVLLALAIGLFSLYLWLDLKFGNIVALGILGGSSTVVAAILLAIVFRRTSGRQKLRMGDRVRAGSEPAQTPVSSIAVAADDMFNGVAELVRSGSRQQITGAIAVAAFIGWLLARRS